MVENRPILNILAHLVLILGVLVVAFPIYIAFIASTHGPTDFLSGLIPLTPGHDTWHTYMTMLTTGMQSSGMPPLSLQMMNSLIMALTIAIGKISISIISAYAIVYFRFPFRNLAFWLIFITLMLPVEVRILPTYKVVADLGMLDTYAGLTIPLIASATATFLFRQVFLTIAALFVILFIYGWNQYLWPLLITTDASHYTIVMGIKRMADVADSQPQWNYIMATAILAMLPPVFVVIFMQKLFVKGLIETEK
jgi:sn-glycerol 3-phosphate transport system permease protein